jgi:hypothetical protein
VTASASSRVPWATVEEIAWADAHGVDLSEWVRAEHVTGIRIAATLIERARQRRLRAIDRAIARRGDTLSELHRRGQHAAETTQQERREHRISVTRTTDRQRWQAVCTCGWVGRPAPTRQIAEGDADTERRYTFRPLSQAVEHTGGTSAAREGLAS